MKENGVPFLEAVGECRFDEAFIEWLHTRSKGNVVRHKMTGRCRTSTQCFTMDTLTEACRSEHLRIMKVIRFRIRWMRELLSSSKFDFKLVHLIRDPRASLRSMYSHHLTKLQPDYYCPLIEDDLNQIKELESEFPGQVLKLKYESFCLDPEGQSSKLWRFLSGNQTASLPPEWTAFLEKHTHKKSNHIDPVYGTVRDTRDEYLAWRWEIHEDLLADVEKYCASAIHNLGYNLFGTIDVARNKSVPLFLEDL
ncbi:Carbohydrate sulfotransferase 4 [Portunus trituberculatus]|uniref:Carbohydrate sulfotransferase 4 n=1 Tax=Portunus trituberculatus TaxID=210409 RepID=A0A5B7D7T4_PORTR|nr:Carbohydrate sulfotransferase 4 [Portunus trituberculatus]